LAGEPGIEKRGNPDGERYALPPGMLYQSGRSEIDGRSLAIAAGFDFVAQALVTLERRHAGSLDGRDVHEAVGAAVVRLNEAIALVGIEEFHGAYWHELFLSRTMVARAQECTRAVRRIVIRKEVVVKSRQSRAVKAGKGGDFLPKSVAKFNVSGGALARSRAFT